MRRKLVGFMRFRGLDKVNKDEFLWGDMVMNVEFIGQLVDSMDDAVAEMEVAIEKGRTDDANRLRTFVFDLHSQIAKIGRGKNVRRPQG